MKAKEYVKQFKIFIGDSQDVVKHVDGLGLVLRMILTEVSDTAKKRNCKTTDAYMACFREAQDKWISVCDAVNHPECKPSFVNVLKTMFPDIGVYFEAHLTHCYSVKR